MPTPLLIFILLLFVVVILALIERYFFSRKITYNAYVIDRDMIETFDGDDEYYLNVKYDDNKKTATVKVSKDLFDFAETNDMIFIDIITGKITKVEYQIEKSK